jgi:hypothetical protein
MPEDRIRIGTTEGSTPSEAPPQAEAAPDEEGDELEDHWRDILGPRPESVEQRLVRDLGLTRPGALTICRESGEAIVSIQADGTLVYGAGYTPDEAAEVFWTNMALKKQGMDARLRSLSQMEAMIARIGQADLRYERAFRAALTQEAGEPERTATERCRMHLEALVHQLIEHSRGVSHQYANMRLEPEVPVAALAPMEPAAPRQEPADPACLTCHGRGTVIGDCDGSLNVWLDPCPTCRPTPATTVPPT